MSDVQAPNLDAITERDLRDDERLKTLYVEAVRRRFWANNARDALEFFCLAEKALRDDSQQTPGKLFYALIKQKSREFVTQEIENRALLRLPSHERQALVDRAARSSALPAPMPKDVQETLFGRDVGYHHGIMAQCFLPQKPPPPSSNSKGSRCFNDVGREGLAARRVCRGQRRGRYPHRTRGAGPHGDAPEHTGSGGADAPGEGGVRSVGHGRGSRFGPRGWVVIKEAAAAAVRRRCPAVARDR